MMRAVVLDGTGPDAAPRTAEIEPPQPVLSELLIRVVAAGVNPIDVKTRRGAGMSGAIDAFPIVPGMDVSGVVVRAPDETHPLQPGTPVFGMVSFPRTGGGYAEYAVAPSLSLARKPASLSHVEAAAVPLAALTAWGLVETAARIRPGQRVLIHAGSGGVGHFAVQLAARAGAEVIATGSARNLDWLRGLGAAEAIDYTTTRFEDVVRDVDVVLDLIGNVHDDTGTRSLEAIRPGGLYVLVPTGGWPGYAEAAAARGIRATGHRVVPDGRALATIGALLDAGRLRVHVDAVHDLDDAAAAHAAVEGGHTRGKIVLRVGGD